MMGVPQSRWGYSEVLRVHTYVLPKTPRQPFRGPGFFRAPPLSVTDTVSHSPASNTETVPVAGAGQMGPK